MSPQTRSINRPRPATDSWMAAEPPGRSVYLGRTEKLAHRMTRRKYSLSSGKVTMSPSRTTTISA